jgi:apolipoprotein N-acyltransferase
MPFVQLLKPYMGDWAIDLGGTSGTLGVSARRKVFKDANVGLKLAPIICWENEFSDYATAYAREGANLIAVITNDGWWGNTAGHLQHLRFAGLRAIEQGKYVVRSANTGVSSVIDAKGRVLRRLDWDTEGVIVADVPLLEGKTLYVRTGNWIGKAAVGLFTLLVLIILFSRFFRLKPR